MVIGLLVKLHAVLFERLRAALVAPLGRIGQKPVAAQNCNMPVAAADEIIDGAGRALPVVGGNAGQVFKRQLARVVRDDDGRDADLVKIRGQIAVRRAEKHEAHRLALAAELDGAQNLVVILVDEINDQRMARA